MGPSIDPTQMGMPDTPTSGFTMPPPQMGGMFGATPKQAIGEALMAAIAGYNARRNPEFASSAMSTLNNRYTLNRQAQLAMLQSNLEFQRQMQMAQLGAQLRLQYPDSPLAQSLYQAGVMPGTPEWTKAMQTQAQNELDPVVNAGPYGPVLRSQVAGAANAAPQPTPAAIAALKANPSLAQQYDEQFGAGSSASILGTNGGQTAPAQSGGFFGPFPDIGPYHRH